MKKIILAILCLPLLFSTGCLGGYRLFGKMNKVIGSATKNRYVNQIFHFLLWIIPVYGIVIFLDLIIFNVIEFWSGSNVLTMSPKQIEIQDINYKGIDYRMIGSLNRLEVKTLSGEKQGHVSVITYDPSNSVWMVSENGAPAVPVISDKNGLYTVFGANQSVVLSQAEVNASYFLNNMSQNQFAFVEQK